MPTVCVECGKQIESLSSGISLGVCQVCKKELTGLRKAHGIEPKQEDRT